MVDDWLSAAEGDGQIERTVHLSNTNDLSQGRSLLQSNIKRKFFDDHIWLSVLYRKSRSPFTRVQRLSSCLTILYLMMITNAMWYGRSNSTGNQTAIVIGPIRLTIMQLYTSIMSSAVMVPPMLITTAIFQRVRARPAKGRSRYAMGPLGAGDRADLKKKRGFPWWFIFIAYLLLLGAAASGAFFTILYALQWGKAKSEEWLVTFLFSYFEDLCLIQPIKVRNCVLPQVKMHKRVA